MLRRALILAAVWRVMTESEKMLSVCLYNSPLVRLKLSDEKWKVGASISQLYRFIFPGTMTMESTVSCVMCVSPPNWPVWSLGEGQPPEELEKPIDTPPLSILLMEKPQSATVTVGEWQHKKLKRVVDDKT